MKIGDIKIQALQLMFASYEAMTLAQIADLYLDETTAAYLNAMPGSINRALDRFAAVGFMLDASVDVEDLTETEDDDYYTTVDLTEIADFGTIIRVEYNDGYGYIQPNVDFTIEGDTLRYPSYTDGTVRIVYYKALPYLTDASTDTTELAIPDTWARLIPLFVKSELYEEQQPNLAAAARNLFEASLQSLPKKKNTQQRLIRVVFPMDE